MVGAEVVPDAERDLMSGKKCFFRREETEEIEVMRVLGGLMSNVRGEDDGAESSCFSSSSSM